MSKILTICILVASVALTGCTAAYSRLKAVEQQGMNTKSKIAVDPKTIKEIHVLGNPDGEDLYFKLHCYFYLQKSTLPKLVEIGVIDKLPKCVPFEGQIITDINAPEDVLVVYVDNDKWEAGIYNSGIELMHEDTYGTHHITALGPYLGAHIFNIYAKWDKDHGTNLEKYKLLSED
jgi:hypothetical protein